MDSSSMLQQMTLQQKASLLAGASHWDTVRVDEVGLESITLSDGPHGLRHQLGAADHLGINQSVPSTCFPSASALACSFDPNLVLSVGAAIADEAVDQGVSVVLGPGVNIKRSPLCGRNFEYFSEDPLLSGELGAAMVQGIQSRGVAACLKHFACNNQELARLVSDSVVDERTLREIYLRPFQMLVEDYDAVGLMSSYNRIGAVWAGGSEALLTGILRDEWGFNGAVITDFSDHHKYMNGDQALRAGGSLWMSGFSGKMACETGSNSYMQALRRATKETLYMYLHVRVTNRDYAESIGESGVKS